MAIETQRRHVHTRSIRVDAYARDDGLWEVKGGAATAGAHDERKPFQLDQCHALVTTGPAVAKFYPRWFRGAERTTEKSASEQGETR